MKRTTSQKGFGVIAALVIVAIIAAAGGFAAYRMKKQPTVANQETLPTVTPKPSAQVSAGSTNADLDKDSQDVSTKLKAINDDASSVDQGLNDQQGNLSEQ